MRKVCAWCKKQIGDLGSGETKNPDEETVTHGICLSCSELFVNESDSVKWHEFLDRLEGPIIAVDDEGKLAAANTAAAKATGKRLVDLKGMLGGDAIECAYAKLPGGCGKTEHCVACAIRITVMKTHKTGISHSEVPAYNNLGTLAEAKAVRFLISTEKVGPYVLLRIDEVIKLSS